MFTSALITYLVIRKNVDEEAILRLIELSPAKKWPVQFMLAQAFPMELYYAVYEDDDNRSQRLTSQSIWQQMAS